MSTFEQAVRAALDEIDGNTHLDHWRIYDSDKLTESILAHLTAWALARAEAEDNNQPVPNGDAGEPRTSAPSARVHETKGPAVSPQDQEEAAGWAS